MNNTLALCKTGDHSLEIIFEYHSCPISKLVTRWCKICGSVVVDLDEDNRVHPGYYMKMKSPEISKQCQNS